MVQGPLLVPPARSPIADAKGLAPSEWYEFFRRLLAYLQQTGVDPAVIADILARLDALEASELGPFLILGPLSVQVQGTPANGNVLVQLENDADQPGNTYYYGTGPDGTKGWNTVRSALDFGDGIDLTTGSDGVTEISFNADTAEVAHLPGATYKTVQKLIDVLFSPGLISGGDLTELTPTSVRVEAGTAVVRVADDNVSELRFFDFPAQDFTISDVQITHYYRLEYNGGSPIITDNPLDDADRDTEIPMGAASRADGFLNLIPNPYRVGDVITNLIQRLDAVSPVQRDNSVGGLELGNTATRTTTLTSGRLWSRVSDFLIPAKNSSVDTMSSAFYNGGTPALTVVSGLTQWDNLQYNDTGAGTLVAMGNNKFANLWFFMSFNGDHYGWVYGTDEYNTVGEAANESIPFFLPQNFFRQYILLGRYIFEKGVDTPVLIESAFETLFTTQAVNDHNLLGGLQGGTTGEYYHLTAAQQADVATLSTGGTTGQFWRGDQIYSNRLDGPIGIFTDADSADALLSINANSLSNPVPGIHVWADNGTTQANIDATTYGVNGGGIFHGRMANGTKAAPTQVLKDQIYAGYGGRPYASGVGFTASSPVSTHWVASENQASGALGGYWRVLTTPKGSGTRYSRLVVTDAGTAWSHDTGTYDESSNAQYAFLTGWTGFLSSAVNQNARLAAVAYGAASGIGVVNIGAVNGTPDAPTPLLAGQRLGSLSYTTYSGANWIAPAVMLCQAEENHSAVAQGTSYVFEVTPNGTASRITGLKIEHDGRVWGSALHNNAGAVTGTTQQYIASGTYTPTLTNVTNIASSTPAACQWMRVGNVVTVGGRVVIDPTAVGLIQLGLSLPIASDLTAVEQVGGTGASNNEFVRFYADTVNDRATVESIIKTDAASAGFHFTFTYLIA